MSESNPPRTRLQTIGLIAGIALFGLTLLAPLPAGMTPEARRMAAVSLLMAAWWIFEAANIALTALLPLVLFPALGILPSDKVAPNYGDPTIFLFLGGFVVALAIQRWNLHKRIALHTVRLLGAQPTRLLLGFMVATALLSMWMSNTACTMMMFPIGMALVLQLAAVPGAEAEGKPRNDPYITENFGSVLMLAIAYSATLGGMATLIGTPTNMIFAGANRRLFPEAPEIGFLQWSAVGFPLTVVFVPLMWLYLCRFSSSVPLSRIRFRSSETVIEDELRKLGAMSRPEKRVLAVWGAMALLWIFRSPLNLGGLVVPGWAQLFGKPAFLHDATVAMTMAVLLCLIPAAEKTADGEGGTRAFLMDWDTIQHGVPWGILLLFGGGFALAAGFEETGLSRWIGSLLGGMRGFPPVLMVVLTSLLLVFLGEVTSNTASAVMAMPVLAAVAVEVGVHPYLLMVAGTLASSCGFMLPVATPPNAIVFSSRWIPVSQMARTGFALDLLGVALVTAAMYLLAIPVFGISFGQLPAWLK